MSSNLKINMDTCFMNLGVESEDLMGVTGWFCVAQWVIRFSNDCAMEKDEFKRVINSNELHNHLIQLELEHFSITQKVNELLQLVTLIQKSAYVRGKAKMFFCDYLPWVIADRSFFAETDSDRLGGAVQCSLVYLAMLYAGENLGGNEIHAVQSASVFEAHRKTFAVIGVDYPTFECVWDAVHCLAIQGKKDRRGKIEKVLKTYKQYNVPPAMLLHHYACINKLGVENLKGSFNPWEDVQLNLNGVCPERGLTTEEELFNGKTFAIAREKPTDVIQTIFYKNRDDSAMEITLARTEVMLNLNKAAKVLVVNPSPAFLEVYAWLDSVQRDTNRETVFAVTDDTVCAVYSHQFSKPFQFITISQLEKQEKQFDYVVIMARDFEMKPLLSALPLCKEGGNLTFFVPQTELTNREATFLNTIRRENIKIDTIMDIPACLCQSRPKKKMVVSAEKNSRSDDNWINLIFSACSKDKLWLVPEKKMISIPFDMLSRNMSLRQIRRAVSENGKLPQPRECSEYRFSREIKIAYYFIYGKNGQLERARAYYRSIHRADQRNRQKGTRPNDVRTERGLRGKTPADIMKRMEGVAFYEEFYNSIVADILDFYKADFSVLTLKTLWFCCRKMLCSCVSNFDELAMEVFCGESQDLWDIPVRDCSPKSVYEAIQGDVEETYGVQLWSLLHLIFKVAVENGLAAENPFAPMVRTVRDRNRERLYQLNAALKKSNFTEEEEKRMVDWLMEEIPVPPRLLKAHSKLSVQEKNEEPVTLPRCVLESKWLIGAFSLFTGLPIRELCPLCWRDLREIGSTGAMQVYITKHLDGRDQVVLNVFYADQQRYRKVPLVSVLSYLLRRRKQFLIDYYGYTEEMLGSMLIILEKEQFGRGRKKMAMLSRKHAQQLKRQLLDIARIEPDVISLLEGESRFDVDLNANKKDLFAASFREKALHISGFTEGELCHYTGNKAPDTFERHYCDYNNDFLQYAMAKKLNRWAYIYNPNVSSDCTANSSHQELEMKEIYNYLSGCFLAGSAEMEIDLVLSEPSDGTIDIEIECTHGMKGEVVCFDK